MRHIVLPAALALALAVAGCGGSPKTELPPEQIATALRKIKSELAHYQASMVQDAMQHQGKKGACNEDGAYLVVMAATVTLTAKAFTTTEAGAAPVNVFQSLGSSRTRTATTVLVQHITPTDLSDVRAVLSAEDERSISEQLKKYNKGINNITENAGDRENCIRLTHPDGSKSDPNKFTFGLEIEDKGEVKVGLGAIASVGAETYSMTGDSIDIYFTVLNAETIRRLARGPGGVKEIAAEAAKETGAATFSLPSTGMATMGLPVILQ